MKLSAVREIVREIEMTRNQLESLRTAATNITTKIDGLPRAKERSSKTETFATLITDAENRLAELCNEYADAAFKLADEITRRVHGKASEVLFWRYCMCKSFSDISAELSYSEPRIFQLHRQGKLEYERTETDDKN